MEGVIHRGKILELFNTSSLSFTWNRNIERTSAIWNSSNFLLGSSEARNTTWNVIWNRNTFVGFFFFHFSCFTRTKYKQKIVFSPADFSLSVYMENFACVLRIRKGWSWEIKFKTVENTCKITIPVTDLHTFSLLIYKCSNYVRSTSAVCAIYDYSLCKYGKRYSSGNIKVWSCKKHFRISKNSWTATKVN